MKLDDLIRNDISKVFDSRSYQRGLKYFKNNHVVKAIRTQNKLVGKVRGSRSTPYQIEVQVDDNDKIASYCTCPVNYMCKHGVAVLLAWINNSSSFILADNIIDSL